MDPILEIIRLGFKSSFVKPVFIHVTFIHICYTCNYLYYVVKYIFLVEDRIDVHVKQYIIDIIYLFRLNSIHIFTVYLQLSTIQPNISLMNILLTTK